MFQNYRDIFNQRGFNYHQAMLQYPFARKEEFQNIIKLLDLEDDHLILDIPSGGCYINNFIHHDLKIISVDTSKEFINHSQISHNNNLLLCEDFINIPLTSNNVDRVFSLAALHHIKDKISFYQEIYRILKKDGVFVIGDVYKSSKIADFLNIFVNKYNSLGHQGDFLTNKVKSQLESLNFHVAENYLINYNWHFDSLLSAINYCKLLFGLDKANDEIIEKVIKEYLGYSVQDNKCYLNWELYFVKAIKS